MVGKCVYCGEKREENISQVSVQMLMKYILVLHKKYLNNSIFID